MKYLQRLPMVLLWAVLTIAVLPFALLAIIFKAFTPKGTDYE